MAVFLLTCVVLLVSILDAMTTYRVVQLQRRVIELELHERLHRELLMLLGVSYERLRGEDER